MAGAIKRQAEHGGARHALDKFYTKDDIALGCISSITELLSSADIVVEPSAGAGAFSRQLSHTNFKAYDLEPENEAIQQANWFEVTRQMIGDGSLLVIGNPPFGVRQDLAKRFIRHAIELQAETIAFILPKVFSKALFQQQNLFPGEYRLVVETELPDDSFTVEGESLHIPCTWYVWTTRTDFKPETDLRKTLLADSPDFKFMPRGSAEADFTLNGNNGRVKDLSQVTNPKAEHYIRVTDRSKVDSVREHFTELPFDFKSSVNGGVAWVGKQEILTAYAHVKNGN